MQEMLLDQWLYETNTQTLFSLYIVECTQHSINSYVYVYMKLSHVMSTVKNDQ